MEQLEGFKAKSKEQLVCKLKKNLYGLKQAPRQWYKKFDSFMVDHGYDRTTSDHCVFMKRFPNGNFIIILLYVDDMLIVGHNAKKIQILKEKLSKSFAMKYLGLTKQILGMKITHNQKKEKCWLSQERYVQKVLERFHMSNSKPVCSPFASQFKPSSKQCPSNDEEIDKMKKVPYASAVGSLMYAMIQLKGTVAPSRRSAASWQPSTDFGVFLFCVKESPPSILVTKNPNWSFRDSKARHQMRKGKVLVSLVRLT